jgi:MYXO-CTERM domain-containing protein
VSARHAVVALAGALAAFPAAGFVRTKDSGTGKELFWPVPAVPWYLNHDWPSAAPSCRATADADPVLATVRASFAEWEQSCTSLRFVEGGTVEEIRTGGKGTPENLVVFRRGWCSQLPAAANDPCFDDPAVDCGGIFGCFEDDSCAPAASDCVEWRTVALTSVLYEPDTGRLLDADVEVNAWDGTNVGRPIASTPRGLPQHGWYFTCYDTQPAAAVCTSYGQDGCPAMDLRNTLTHEIGHVLGLAHVPDTNATMHGATEMGELKKRSLSPDDIAGVCAIYPVSDGGCGCGSAGGAGALALLVAALALRRRQV